MKGLRAERRKVLLGAAALGAALAPATTSAQQQRPDRRATGTEPAAPHPSTASRPGPAWDTTGRTFLFDPDLDTARTIDMSSGIARVVQLADVGGSGRAVRQLARPSVRPPLVTAFGRGVLDLDQGLAYLDADGTVEKDMRNIAPATGATVHVVWITPARLGSDICPLFGVYTADSYYPCNIIGINDAQSGQGLINWRTGQDSYTAGSIRTWKPNAAYLLTVRYNPNGSTDLFVDGVKQGVSDALAPPDTVIEVTGGELGGFWPSGHVRNAYGKIGAVMRYAMPRSDATIAADAMIKKQRYWDVTSTLGRDDQRPPHPPASMA